VSRLGVLGERRFRRYFIGQTTSWLGDGLLPVAISFAVLELTGSATDLGLVLAVRMIPVVAFVLVGGVWADRLPRQWVMIGSDVVRGASQAVLAALLLTGSAELWHLLALQAVYGTAEAFWRPASTALLPSIVRPEGLQQANSLLAVAVNGSYTVGPAVAGLLVATSGSGVAIAVDAATFGVSTLALLGLRVPALERPAVQPSFVTELREGWHEFASRTWLWVVVAWASVFLMLVIGPLHVLGPVVADEELGGAADWGMIAAASGIGVILGSMAAGRLRFARPMSVGVVLGAASGLSAVSLALALPLGLIVGANFVEGVGHGMFEVIWITALQQRVAPAALARVSSYDALGSFIFMPVGFAIAGPAAAAFGRDQVLLAVAAFALLSSVLVALLPSVRGFRRLEGRDAYDTTTQTA
jgi:MFS family permease